MDVGFELYQAGKRFDRYKQLMKEIRKKYKKQMDRIFHPLHEEVFNEIDCLQCANCCKTTSPIFYENDIQRASKALRMKVAEFTDAYLRIDNDGDYVLKSSPCPFLGYDNKCIIYDSRPTACREYPHTNRKRMYQIGNLTLRNSQVCPAVARIFNKLEEKDFNELVS
jgi:hypothetical protein